MLVRLLAGCHKRKGYTGSVFAGCSAMPCVNFPWDMKLDDKQNIERILISCVLAGTSVAARVYCFRCTLDQTGVGTKRFTKSLDQFAEI
jgi:hypothetical protein